MDPWTLVVVSDIQVGSPRSFRYAPAWNENWAQAREQILAMGPDLLLVGGDLTRDGYLHRYELEGIKRDLDALPFPVHVVPGNMDTGNKHTRLAGAHRRSDDQLDDLDINVTSEQLRTFQSVFGPLWWSFEYRGVRFSGLPSMVVGSGLPEEDAFWVWADGQMRLPRARQHVWMLHYPPFVESPDEPNWDIGDPDQYHAWYFSIDQPGRGRLLQLFRETGATLVINGHVHCRKTFDIEGTRFVISPATCMSQWADHWPDGDPRLGFLRYDVTETGMTGAFVPLDKVSTAQGYGPGGHPAPQVRDYSVAWDKS